MENLPEASDKNLLSHHITKTQHRSVVIIMFKFQTVPPKPPNHYHRMITTGNLFQIPRATGLISSQNIVVVGFFFF